MNFRNGCFAIILVIALVSTVCAADEMIVNDAQGLPGDTVTIPVKIQNAMGIANADMNVTGLNIVCGRMFTITSIDKGSLTKDALFDWQKGSDDRARWSFASGKVIAGSGTVAIITVKVKDNAGQQGEITCPFRVTGTFYDNDNNRLGYYQVVSGFSLAPAIKGDGDNDGKVTTRDALAALQMSVGKLTPDMKYDMNDDRIINSNDVREILRRSLVAERSPVTGQKVIEQVQNVSGLKKAETKSVGNPVVLHTLSHGI